MEIRDKLYIDGAWVPSAGDRVLGVFDSNTEEVLGTIPDGTSDDVEHAVAAASATFAGWSTVSHEERAKLLARVGEGLAARTDEIAETISREVGMPLSLSKIIQVGLPTGVFADMAKTLTEFQWETEVGNSLVRSE